MIHQFGFPNHISSATCYQVSSWVGFIYVDDCGLSVLAPPSNLNLQVVLQILQCNMDIWLARQPGSHWWYAFLGEMVREQPFLLPQGQKMEALLLPNLPHYSNHLGWTQLLPLKLCNPHEAVKVVGIHQSLSEFLKVQIASLTKKLDAWVTTILQGHLPSKNLLARPTHHDLAILVLPPSCLNHL